MPSGLEGSPTFGFPASTQAGQRPFYEAVFGWRLRGDPDEPSFEDGTGHVIGHFMADLPVAGEAGVWPCIFVERVDETLDKVVAYGGEVVTARYSEGDLWVATFRDPRGNVLGVWQHGHATWLTELPRRSQQTTQPARAKPS